MNLPTSRLALAAALGLIVLAAGCAQGAASGPDALAERITRAVYANDFDGTVATFDDALKKSATRSSVGDVSDRMHALGTLKTVKRRSADADRGRYDYDLTFERGTMLAQLRLDSSGRVGAYRVVPSRSGRIW